MHEIGFYKRALKALKKMPKARAAQVLGAIDELAATPDPTTHHKVCPMRGTDEGDYRLRIGEYRAIFELHDTPEGRIQLNIFVTAIGSRGDIYG